MSEICKNNFGVLNEEHITLTIQNKKQKIALKNIIKIEFLKRQKLHLNYGAFILATYLLFFIQKNEISNTYQAITLLFVTILLLTSFYLKQFQYKLIVIKKNDFLAITVTKRLSEDADDFAKQTKKHLASETIAIIGTKTLKEDVADLAKQTKKLVANEMF